MDLEKQIKDAEVVIDLCGGFLQDSIKSLRRIGLDKAIGEDVIIGVLAYIAYRKRYESEETIASGEEAVALLKDLVLSDVSNASQAEYVEKILDENLKVAQ